MNKSLALCCPVALAWLSACASADRVPVAPDAVTAGPGGAVVWPDEAFRYEAPKPGPTPKVATPIPDVFTLQNGLEVYLIHDPTLPTVTFNLTFDVGGVADPSNKEGLASVAMSLLSSGTERLDTVAFSSAQADLGSQVYAGGGLEQVNVGARTLKVNLDATLALLVEMLSTPGLRDDDLERIRKQRLTGLAQAKAAPGSLGRRLWGSVVYGPEHPYGSIATEDDLESITRKDCERFVRALKPSTARLFVAGDLTRDELKTRVAPVLTKWRGGEGHRVKKPGKAEPREGTVFFVDVPGAAQSQIYIGHPGPSRKADDYEATQLMARILGGGFTSRINMNIREDKGFAYGARAGFAYRRHGGAFAASSSVRTDATVPSIEEMVKEIKAIRGAVVQPEEIDRERDGILLSLPARFSTGRKLLGTYANLAFYGLPLDYYAQYQERVAKTAPEDLLDAAKKHLRDGDYKVLVVGDGAVVREGLQQLATSGALGAGGFVELNADGVPLGGDKKSKKRAKGKSTKKSKG